MNAEKTTKLFQKNRNTFLLIAIIILSIGLLYYVLFVNKDISQFFGKTPSPTSVKEFPALEKRLKEVVSNPDPEKTAVENDLAVEGETIKVVITLKDESFVLTDTYGKEELRYGKYIQASVKISKLEELAKNPKIETIVAPLKGGTPPPFQE